MPRTGKIHQSSVEKRYYFLSYLARKGTWVNASKLKRGYEGSDIDRTKARKILDDFATRGFVEKQTPEHSAAKYEYRIKEKGRKELEYFDNMDDDRRHFIGLRTKETTED